MRNFLAAIALVFVGAVSNLSMKPWAAKDDASGAVKDAGVVVAKDGPVSLKRPYPAEEVAKATRAVIATVPDPKLTRLGLHFDRWIESLQRAAEFHGYTFESQWIPWTVTQTEYTEPGVLVFRRGSDKLAILLVGESPVAGIAVKQFEKALQQAQPNLAGVIGPTFSGGFRGLPHLLRGQPPELMIVGGSATSGAAIAAFRKERQYTSTVESDEEANAALESYLRDVRVSIPRRADLAEGDTDYGKGHSADGENVRKFRFVFPRDMAVLRRAYESDQRLRRSISQQSAVDSDVSVQISRGDDSGGADGVPTQAPGATAATQELSMRALAKRLAEDRVSLANIYATNTLDILFLRQFMATHVPDMQFLLLEPDILFLHRPEVNAFQGSLALTRYPLFLSPGEKKAVAFPSKAAQGVYEAAKAAIGGVLENGTDPELWLTIVGLDGYWPVALLKGKPPEFAIVPRFFGAAVMAWAAALMVLAWALLEGLRARRWKRAPRKWFADFYFDPEAPLRFARQYHCYCLALSVVVTAMILCRPWAEVRSDFVYALALPGILCLWAAWPAKEDERRFSLGEYWFDAAVTATDRKVTRALVLVTTAGAAAFLLIYFLSVWNEHGGAWVRFAAYRSMYFGNGVNPILPLLLGALSVGVCSWHHFQRFIFASERFVPLDLDGFGMLQGPYERVRNILSRYSTLPGTVAGCVTAVVVLGLTWSHGSSLSVEGSRYDLLVSMVFALAAGLTVLSVSQFLQTWWNLSDFLKGLDQLPVRRTFEKLPRSLGSIALFRSSTRQRSYVYLLRSRELMRRMPFLPKWIRSNAETSVDRLLIRGGADERETGEEAVEVQITMMMASSFLLYHLLRESWNKGDSELQPRKEGPLEVQLAEEFVALRFLGFIRYATLQLRNLLTYFSVSFILLALGVSSYPFFSQSLSQLYIFSSFLILSGASGYVFVQMGRDSILKKLSSDSEGKDHPLLQQALQSASLPVLAFASTYFPDLGRTLFSWLQPLLSSGK